MGCALGRDIRSVGWGLLGIMPLGIVQVYVAWKVVQYQGVLHPTGFYNNYGPSFLDTTCMCGNLSCMVRTWIATPPKSDLQ
jgi:hypothetical protein